jgi:pimeloyl-ACP methyl ester carboxylesterase
LKSLPRDTKLRHRHARIISISAAALLISPILLLHLASFLFSLHDGNMEPFASRAVSDSFGHPLRFYELKQPDAEWDLIFIHGTPATAAIFGEQFHHPYPHANLLALDRPGFGASSPGNFKPSLEAQADAIGALLAGNPPRKTILVGHSYGAPVALTAALRFTNQVAGVVLIGGSVDPGQERTYAIQRFADWPTLSWLVPQSLRQCNRELLTLRSDLIRLRSQLPTLQVPVVMLHGGKDRQVPVANVDYLRAQLATANRTNLFNQLVFPDYNHFIPWEHPGAVEAAIHMVTRDLNQSSQNR